jgi:putative FmdB family regulatory protein
MPTYEYQCEACGNKFEKFQSITAAPIKKCPKCGKNKVKRLIGTGAGILFKGSGFYITDYRDKSYTDKAKAESGGSGESKSGESKSGETKSTESTSKDAAKPATTAEAQPAVKTETKPASKSSKKSPKSE